MIRVTCRSRHCHLVLIVLVALSGCQQKPRSETSEDTRAIAISRQAEPMKIATYQRVAPVSGQPVPTFHNAAVQGSLSLHGGCLVLNVEHRSLLLVFAADAVRLLDRQTVLIDNRAFHVGKAVRVGGSSTGGSAVAAAEIPAECSGLERWFVTPGSAE